MPAFKRIFVFSRLAFLAFFAAGFIAAQTASALVPNSPSTGSSSTSTPTTSSSTSGTDPCAKTPTQQDVQKCLNQSPLTHDIQLIVDWLSAGVGIVVVGVIVAGGIQYIMAGDNPNALQAARQRMTNGVAALFIFLFMFAFLQWLIPGGVFQ